MRLEERERVDVTYLRKRGLSASFTSKSKKKRLLKDLDEVEKSEIAKASLEGMELQKSIAERHGISR